MPWNKRWLVPPLGLLGSFVVWRSLKRTPLSKVASSAEIGRLRSESHQNLAKMDDAKRSPSPGMTKNKASPSPLQQNHLSYMSTRSLVRLMWQTFNSGHFRGGLRRGVFIALLCAWGTRWLMRYLGFSRQWSLARLTTANLIVFWFFYYRRHIVEMPVLHFYRDFYHISLVLRSKISQTSFRPVPWLADRHAQTVLGSVLNDLDNFSVFQLPIKTRRVLLISDHDGQHINLDWYESTESAKAGGNAGGGVGGGTGDGDGAGGAGVPVTSSAARAASTASAAEEKCDEADRSPIIILIHGIAGNSQEGYMCRLAHSFVRQGWRACSYDYWRFDFGHWQDLDTVVQHLSNKFPRAPIAAVGVSAGGHVLLRYLQCTGDRCPLVAAVAISPCQDLIQETQRVRAEENPGYMYFLRYCVMTCAARHVAEGNWTEEQLKAYEVVLRDSKKGDIELIYDRFLPLFKYSRPDAPEFETVRQRAAAVRRKRLDELQLARDNGAAIEDEERLLYPEGRFEETADHYVGVAASHMDKIGVTLLWIHAKDDPIVAYKTVDWEEVHRNKNIITLVTKRGGHVQWHAGLSPTGLTFADNATLQFLSSVLQLQAESRYFVDVVQRTFESLNIMSPPTAGSVAAVAASHLVANSPQQVRNAVAQPLSSGTTAGSGGGGGRAESPISYSPASSVSSAMSSIAYSPSTVPTNGNNSNNNNNNDDDNSSAAAASSTLDVNPGAFARICSHSDLRAASVADMRSLTASRGFGRTL